MAGLPGRVEQLGGAAGRVWSVYFPAGDIEGSEHELKFEGEAPAVQALRLLRLQHALQAPGHQDAAVSLAAEVQVCQQAARAAGIPACAAAATARSWPPLAARLPRR